MNYETNNWFIKCLQKEARRRYRSNDKVRFFTEQRKGRGKGIVFTPNFQKGQIIDYQPDARRYIINDGNTDHSIHPRNIVPDNFGRTSTETTNNGTVI